MNNINIFILAIICIFIHSIFNSSKIIFADKSPKLSALMSSCAYMLNVCTLPLVNENIFVSVIFVGIFSFIGSMIGLMVSKIYLSRNKVKSTNVKN